MYESLTTTAAGSKLLEVRNHVERVKNAKELNKESAEKIESLSKKVEEWEGNIARIKGELAGLPNVPGDENMQKTIQEAILTLEAIEADAKTHVEMLLGNSNESHPTEQKKVNKMIRSIEERTIQKPKSVRLDSSNPLAKDFGSNPIEFSDIPTLEPKEKREALLSEMIKTKSPSVFFDNPELLKLLTPDQMVKLNAPNGQGSMLLEYADPVTGGEKLDSMRNTSEYNMLAGSAQRQVEAWKGANANGEMAKSMYAMKFAELFARTKESIHDKEFKIHGGIYKEFLGKVFTDIPAAFQKMKTDFTELLQKRGVERLAFAVGGGESLARILKGPTFQKNFFREKSLFEELKGSKNVLKEKMDEENERSAEDVLKVYVALKHAGLLTESQFKELTTLPG